MGIARQIRSLVDGMNCAVRCDGARRGAAGLFGGKPGAPGRVFSNYGRPDQKQMPPKIATHILDAGQSMRIETQDRQRVVEGKSVSVRVDLVGGRVVKKKN